MEEGERDGGMEEEEEGVRRVRVWRGSGRKRGKGELGKELEGEEGEREGEI